MNRMEHAEKLLSLVEEGTSPFHVAAAHQTRKSTMCDTIRGGWLQPSSLPPVIKEAPWPRGYYW